VGRPGRQARLANAADSPRSTTRVEPISGPYGGFGGLRQPSALAYDGDKRTGTRTDTHTSDARLPTFMGRDGAHAAVVGRQKTRGPRKGWLASLMPPPSSLESGAAAAPRTPRRQPAMVSYISTVLAAQRVCQRADVEPITGRGSEVRTLTPAHMNTDSSPYARHHWCSPSLR
jgi:hypothetical protein